jgi:hypothetical protein
VLLPVGALDSSVVSEFSTGPTLIIFGFSIKESGANSAHEKLTKTLLLKIPYKFKESYGGTPEPQTPVDAPWLHGPSL